MIFKSTALASLAAIPAHGAGCYPAWSSGSDYFTGSLVSATITETYTSTASDGTVTETTTSQRKNFKCTSGSQPSLSHCPDYDPSNTLQQAAAWSDQGVCSGTAAALTTPAPTTKPTPSRWTNTGCPEEWTSGGSYEGGDLVELDGNVYSCSTATGANLWCGLDAYKPGDSVHWEQAWKLLGSCDGTIRPTTAPVYTSLTNHNGCPVEFDASATYEAGDKVELYGLVYECRSWSNSGWCSQEGYEPDGANYKDAWIVLGFCEGTMTPTTSPNFSSLVEVGDGCPKEYASSTVYEAGDQVSVVSVNNVKSVVYECKSWPNGAYCNSGADFAPGTDNGNLGWTKKGFCDGTLSPTKAPIAYEPKAKCRWYNGTKAVMVEPWRDSDRSTYVAGTRVRKGMNIYKCKSFPFSLWCKTPVEYEPEVGSAWKDSWTKAGECNGQFEPTTSPSASPTGAPSSAPSSEPSSGPSLFPSESPSFIATTTIAIESFVELNANCNDLGADTAGHVEDSISEAVGPALDENQSVDSVVVTSICGVTINGRRKLQQETSSARIEYTLQVSEANTEVSATLSNTEVSAPLSNTMQSVLISSFNDGSFETLLREKSGENYSVSPVTTDDFVTTLVTPSPTGVPSAMPSTIPSQQPSSQHSSQPSKSSRPSSMPSFQPSLSALPSSQHSSQPSKSTRPSSMPSFSSMPSLSARPSIMPWFEEVGSGYCKDGSGNRYDYFLSFSNSVELCKNDCPKTNEFRGISASMGYCFCWYDDDGLPATRPVPFISSGASNTGTGPILSSSDGIAGVICYKYHTN